jgi:hypothetical protein
MSDVEDLAGRQNGTLNILEAAEHLTALLDLTSVDVQVTGAAMFGSGAAASLDINLSNGETLRFASVRDMVRPQALMAEVVACTGATPQLKQPQAMRAVALARVIAERIELATEDDLMANTALEYLQAAEHLDINLNHQGERYAAFERIGRRDPWLHARDQATTYAAATIVLRDVSGTRLVRVEWFMRHVRELDTRMTPAALNSRMLRIGWQRRGREGRIKATAPGRHATLQWAFWLVPAGWEDSRAGNEVTAGT